MIKVNLLENVDGSATVDLGTAAQTAAPLGTERDKQVGLLRLLLLILPVFALSYYQSEYIIKVKRKQLTQVRMQLQQLKDKNADQGALAEQIEQIQKEKTLFEQRIEVIQGLSKNRSKFVKAIDIVQTLIPEKLWIFDIEVESPRAKINGYSASDEDLSNFMQNLQESSYFRDVYLTSSSDVKIQRGSFKQFEITFELQEVL